MIPAGRVIGVDLGARRIGVAVTDSDQKIATGITTVERAGDRSADHRAIARLVEEYEAVGAVVGLPVQLSGEVGPAAGAALEEIEQLKAVLPVAVETVDERLTTVVAARGMRRGGRSSLRQKAVIDRAAAAELLQTWADRRKGPNG